MSLPIEHTPSAAAAKLAYNIPEAVKATGLSRSTIYREVAAGTVRLVKVRGRSLIPADDLRRLLQVEAGQ